MSYEKFLETINCPICDSQEYHVLKEANYPKNITIDELLEIYRSSSDVELIDQLVKCIGCGLVFLNPRVKLEIIMKSYEEAVDLKFASQNHLRIRTFQKFFQNWVNRLNIIPSKQKKVLDLGCAAGSFPKAAEDIGFSVTGVEPSKYLCDFGRREYGLDLRQGTLHEQKFSEEEFNVVSMFDVIEHLSQPGKILDEIKRILHPEGHLIINYPEYDSWPRKIMRKKWPFFLSVHLFYFTPKSIKQILEKHGFKVIKSEPYYQTLELGYILERASQILFFTKFIEKGVKAISLSQLPFTYYIGQTLVTAKKV